MTTNDKTLGPRQQAALDYIAANPGCTKLEAGNAAVSHGRMEYRYRPVNRLIEMGLVVAKQGKGNSYALYIHE